MHGTILYTSQDTPATLSTLEWYIYRMKHCQATRSYLYRGRREVQLLNASRPRGGLVTPAQACLEPDEGRKRSL